MISAPAQQHALTQRPIAAGAWVRRMKLDPLLDHARAHHTHLPACAHRTLEELAALKLTGNIPLTQYLDFFAAIARALNTPCLGMRIGLCHHSPALSPLQNLFFNGASSLHDALLELNHSATALQNNLRTGLWLEDGRAHVFYQLSVNPEHARHDIEYSLGLLIHALRTRLGAHWSPDELHLAHRLSGCERTLLSALLNGAQVHDNTHNNCIVFPAPLLKKTRTSATIEDNVLIFFRQYLNDLCVEHTGGSIRESVRQLLEQHLRSAPPSGQVAPSLEWAAAQLYLSPRSLQRKLALEQASFSSLLDEVRHHLVLEWMRQPDVHLGAMAEKLGYADHATFCNAFKRWAGVAPSRYRMSATAH